MKKIIKFFRSIMIGLAFGMQKADIEILATKTQSMEGDNVASEVVVMQEGMLNDLKEGRITQEVRQLRYKMYLTMIEASKRKVTSVTMNDFTGDYSVETTMKYRRRAKGDPFDDYRVEIILLNNLNIGETISETHERVDSETNLEKTQNTESKSSIKVERNTIPKFYIENYIQKIYVREIEGEEKLLDLYLSEYPDPNNRRTHALVKELGRLESNPEPTSTMFDMEFLSFETNNCYGIDDHYTLTYEILGFDKVVKYDGYYIVKLKASLYNVEDFISEIYDETQAKKYETNEKKDTVYDFEKMNKGSEWDENSLIGMLKKE